MDIEYALAHADAFIRERVITDIHVAIVAFSQLIKLGAD